MSYDADLEKVYRVELFSGQVIHVMFFDVEEVKQYCYQNYPDEAIKTIHVEVYVGDVAEV